MTTKRRLLAGLVATAVIYLIAAVITIGASSHPFRPLYEGIGPPSPYRWVHPPSAFKSTNVRPVYSSSQSIDLTSEQTDVFGAGTPDGQLVMSIPPGAIPPSAGQNDVEITIAPKDPAKLGSLPAGLYSDGNAYLITATYQPSKEKIANSLKPIDLVIQTPVSSTAVLFSTAGKTWSSVGDHHIPGQTAVASTLTSFGYIVVASNIPVVTGSSSTRNSVLLLVLLGLAAIFLLGISLLWRRGHSRGRRS